MTSVYTNIARKRIEQSQEASQPSPKSTEPKNQGVDIKEQLQEGKSPLRAIVADQNAPPLLSEPAQQDASNIRSA
ncbi:MAG TPA: hypothetical protein VE735_02275, partial [Gammaproteobacteria bacterium]|nr:hypothetical protein [Gammaproteobacteria bacterium]